MMVATHVDDLAAARACGFATAFVARPEQGGEPDDYRAPQEPWIDVMASDYHELVHLLHEYSTDP